MFFRRILLSLTGLAALNCVGSLRLAAEPTPGSPHPIPAAPVPPRYAVTDLGLLPTVSDDVALSLNDAGQVAGWQEINGVVHATLWTNGQVKDLGVPAGFLSSIAHGVNSRGWTVGWATTSRNLVDSLATTHACLFEPGGKVTDLGTLGGRDSQAFGINAGGQIVGGSLRADGVRHAFLYGSGTMADLGALPGGKFSLAYAINDSGAVTGLSETAAHTVHGFLYQGGTMTDLGTLPGGGISLAFAVNNRGEVAGSAVTGHDYDAARYAGGKMEDLGTLGSDPAEASALNDRGQIVGASNLSTIQRHAFLWEKGRMTDLNSLILPGSGWTLLGATAINGTGRIAGIARFKREAVHAVLLLPLTP